MGWLSVAAMSLPAALKRGVESFCFIPWAFFASVIDAIAGDNDSLFLAIGFGLLTGAVLAIASRSKVALGIALTWFALNIAAGYISWWIFSHS